MKALKILTCSICCVLPFAEAMRASFSSAASEQDARDLQSSEAIFCDYRKRLLACDFLSPSEKVLYKNMPSLSAFVENAKELNELVATSHNLKEEEAKKIEAACKEEVKGFFLGVLARSKWQNELMQFVNRVIDTGVLKHSTYSDADMDYSSVDGYLEQKFPIVVYWHDPSDLLLSLIDATATGIDYELQKIFQKRRYFNHYLTSIFFQSLRPEVNEMLRVLLFHALFDSFCFSGRLAAFFDETRNSENEVANAVLVSDATATYRGCDQSAGIFPVSIGSKLTGISQKELQKLCADSKNQFDILRMEVSALCPKLNELISADQPAEKESEKEVEADSQDRGRIIELSLEDEFTAALYYCFRIKKQLENISKHPESGAASPYTEDERTNIWKAIKKVIRTGAHGYEAVEAFLTMNTSIPSYYNAIKLIKLYGSKIEENIDTILEKIIAGEVFEPKTDNDCKEFFEYLSASSTAKRS